VQQPPSLRRNDSNHKFAIQNEEQLWPVCTRYPCSGTMEPKSICDDASSHVFPAINELRREILGIIRHLAQPNKVILRKQCHQPIMKGDDSRVVSRMYIFIFALKKAGYAPI